MPGYSDVNKIVELVIYILLLSHQIVPTTERLALEIVNSDDAYSASMLTSSVEMATVNMAEPVMVVLDLR